MKLYKVTFLKTFFIAILVAGFIVSYTQPTYAIVDNRTPEQKAADEAAERIREEQEAAERAADEAAQKIREQQNEADAAQCTSNTSGVRDSNGALIDKSKLNIPKVGCGDSSNVVARITQLAFGGLGIISVIFVAIGALKYTLSGGDPNSIQSAKNTILYAVIGLVLGLSVFIITSFVIGSI